MLDGPVSTVNAEHYVWGDGCDGWFLVRAAGLHVIEEAMPAGSSEKEHYHETSRQFFYVLAGELTLIVKGTAHTVRAMHGLEVAPGEVHQAVNGGGEAVRFLVISQPPSHGDRADV